MPGFFSKFPLFQTKVGGTRLVIQDFFSRVVVGQRFSQVSTLLIPYVVSQEEAIEDVAHDYYGDPTYHWVVILINGIVDPRQEWPLTNKQMIEKIYALYPFVLTVPETVSYDIGDVVWSSSGGRFVVTDKEISTVSLLSTSGFYQMVDTEILTNVTKGITDLITTHVSDPEEGLHECREADTGYVVDYDLDRITLGEIVYVSHFEWEEELNNRKRNINLLDKKFLGEFVRNFEQELAS